VAFSDDQRRSSFSTRRSALWAIQYTTIGDSWGGAALRKVALWVIQYTTIGDSWGREAAHREGSLSSRSLVAGRLTQERRHLDKQQLVAGRPVHLASGLAGRGHHDVGPVRRQGRRRAWCGSSSEPCAAVANPRERAEPRAREVTSAVPHWPRKESASSC